MHTNMNPFQRLWYAQSSRRPCWEQLTVACSCPCGGPARPLRNQPGEFRCIYSVTLTNALQGHVRENRAVHFLCVPSVLPKYASSHRPLILSPIDPEFLDSQEFEMDISHWANSSSQVPVCSVEPGTPDDVASIVIWFDSTLSLSC
jgi:hypothetical protein